MSLTCKAGILGFLFIRDVSTLLQLSSSFLRAFLSVSKTVSIHCLIMASLTTVGLSLRFPTPPEIQLSLARKWLQDCQNSHQRCHLPQRRLPRRVIDVNPGHEPFLFESLGEFFGEWVALSHCWGTENTFKTTSETYASRCRGFRWEKLPKTFQDAVTVTRMLGVRYLWIDSICIIQDDGYVNEALSFFICLLESQFCLDNSFLI